MTLILPRLTFGSKLLSRTRLYSSKRMAPLRAMLPGRVELPAKLAVQLTETEDQLCTLLDECTTYLKNEKGINTSCRIAGGWVRDKVRYSPHAVNSAPINPSYLALSATT